MEHIAEIISVGTELLLGSTTNTDARDISIMLSEIGINVYYHTVVGDNPGRLKAAVAIAKSRADIIITTGGLGPTCDDLTKQTLAEAFGIRLIFSEEEADRIRSYFERRLSNTHMTENNLQQAYLPEGCTVFHNEWGTAPGCAFVSDGITVMMLPGPPRECISMFRHCAVPYLRSMSDSEIRSHNIRIFGMGESAVEDKLRPMMLRMENPTLAPYAKEGEVMLRVTAKAETGEETDRLMEPAVEEVRKILGDVIYGIDVNSLEETVIGLLLEKDLTISAAESCTGGILAKRLTDIPGASGAFMGGGVTYSNNAKYELADVDPEFLAEYGPYNKETAVMMAEGIKNRLDTDLGIGITGLAGPGSDDTDLIPGTAFVALATPDGTFSRSLQLGNGRERIRTMAANHALDMVRRYLTGLPIEL
ncbi:MAG: competence/damage-inducible protein A [Oscillospiraceae bacterium]|nr:competence/damage-inducible protein A [Oscillospiraceae bacterium]